MREFYKPATRRSEWRNGVLWRGPWSRWSEAATSEGNSYRPPVQMPPPKHPGPILSSTVRSFGLPGPRTSR